MQYSIVNLSEVKQNSDFRIDAEYYHPLFLEMEKNIKKHKYDTIGNYIDLITDGKHGGVNFTENGVVFIRNQNNEEGVPNLSDIKYISSEESNQTKRAELNEGDILLTTIGTIGVSSIIPKNFPRATINQNLVKITTKNISPYFLSTFFNSKYGRALTNRLAGGNVQPILNYPNIKLVIFPIFSVNFQQKIADLVNTSYSLRQSADALYKQAEDELLQELGLKDYDCNNAWIPAFAGMTGENAEMREKEVGMTGNNAGIQENLRAHETTKEQIQKTSKQNYVPANKKCFVKNLSEVEVAVRFDAEYFQPKYEAVIEKIRGYKGGCFCIENKDVRDKNFSPVDDVEYKYIELANINSSSSIDNIEIVKGCDLPSRARRKVKVNDLIVSSVEGSLSSIALITEKFDEALCSTGFYVVNCDKINSESLLVFLKSDVGQMQLKKGCSGTILSAISKDEFEKVVIPNLLLSVQQSISAKIQQSFINKEESLHLLELAKKAVEVAIEQGEDEGLKLINTK